MRRGRDYPVRHELLRKSERADMVIHVRLSKLFDRFLGGAFRFELCRLAVVNFGGGFLALFVEGVAQIGLP